MDDAPIDNEVYGRRNALWKRIDKFDVGLDSVDNTLDINKPISHRQKEAIDAKEPTIVMGVAGQYWRGDKTWAALNKAAVGLSRVDNTPDAEKTVGQALVASYLKSLDTNQLIPVYLVDNGEQP